MLLLLTIGALGLLALAIGVVGVPDLEPEIISAFAGRFTLRMIHVPRVGIDVLFPNLRIPGNYAPGALAALDIAAAALGPLGCLGASGSGIIGGGLGLVGWFCLDGAYRRILFCESSRSILVQF